MGDRGTLVLKDRFERYLIDQGLSVRTPSGNPSTVYDYMKRVDAVCAHEGVTWEHLAANAVAYASKYEIGGIEEEFGNKSHNAVRAAMRHFAALFG